jgi:hypothetical protein
MKPVAQLAGQFTFCTASHKAAEFVSAELAAWLTAPPTKQLAERPAMHS